MGQTRQYYKTISPTSSIGEYEKTIAPFQSKGILLASIVT
jgi:hypothetical protein